MGSVTLPSASDISSATATGYHTGTGWATQSQQTTAEFSSGDSVSGSNFTSQGTATQVSSDVKLYAVKAPYKLTVTFDNGGTLTSFYTKAGSEKTLVDDNNAEKEYSVSAGMGSSREYTYTALDDGTAYMESQSYPSVYYKGKSKAISTTLKVGGWTTHGLNACYYSLDVAENKCGVTPIYDAASPGNIKARITGSDASVTLYPVWVLK